MRLMRLKNPMVVGVNHHDSPTKDCLVLIVPKQQMTGFIQRLVELNSGPAPAGAEGVCLSLYGTVEQHFEEWRPLADNAAGATPAQPERADDDDD